MPPTVPAEHSASPALLDALAGVRRKVKVLSVLFGVGVVLAAVVGLLLATVLVDYLLNLPGLLRALLLIAAAVAAGVLFWRYVARPMLAKVSLGEMAGRLEGAFPQFEDRLRSTVDFVRPDIPGSPTLKRLVITEADRIASTTNFESALVRKPVLWSLGAGLIALVLAVVLAIGFWDHARIAMSRLLLVNAPPWPKRVQISVVKAPPAKIAVGQRMELRMRLAKGDPRRVKAVAFYQYDNGSVLQQLMTHNEDGSYSVAIDARGSAMKVWMKAGDDQTAAQPVSVVQRLDLSRVEIRVSPPPYAKLEPVTFNLKESPAVVTTGSRVDLLLGFNKPLADRPVVLEPVKAEMKLPAVQWQRTAPGVAVASFTATDTLRFRVKATDSDYFENAALEEFQISVKPDQNPTVVIESPRGPEDRTAVSTVGLQAQAEDDFDIATMTLVVKLDRGEEKKQWEIPLSGWTRVDANGGDRRHFRVRYNWDLAALQGANLKPGDVLRYHVRVTDNYSLNSAKHEPAISGELRINIISQETLSTQITDALRAMADRIKQVQNSQNRNRQETAGLRQDTQAKPKLDQADRTMLSRLTDQQSAISSQARQLSGMVEELQRRLDENKSDNQELKDVARDVKTTLSETAEGAMSQASQKLSEAANHADPKAAGPEPKKLEQRNQSLDDSAARQQQASEQLERALSRMGNLGAFEQMLQQVREALAQQQALSSKTRDAGRQTIGKPVDKLTPEERKALEDIAAEQKKLSDRTEKLTTALKKAAQQSQKSDPGSSKAMEQAAQTAQQQQVAPNQSQAAQSAQQNQQAQAQAKQKQAELGLQMMLESMREAERRKLEQLARELAKLQDAIAALVRRQAGHNIDNLRLQGPEPAKQITDELLEMAQRVRDKMPAPPANEQLSNSQIQTEGNTRDISKSAESVARGGADIAALLTKAAGLMERAIVSLRAAQLPAAYDPSQIRALAALVEARDKAAKAMAEVQEQMDEANRETIRQAYEKIRAEQDAINKETVRIDGAPRLPDGSMKREDAVNVRKLPPQQGALADRTKKLEESLSALGGIVYVWANKDIVESMNEVKADLAKPVTGPATQAEQQRIVEQLDAMIRNLATKPKMSPFYGGGGGGGGGGQPKTKLPSESELRLLKELQIAINRSTKTLDKMPKKDQPKLVALGGRQGELRGLLDQLVRKAGGGEVKLDPEPDPKDLLPEEASTGDVESQELDEQLLGGKITDEQIHDDLKQAGQRMARSRQRLALSHDPGKTTQIIQDRILQNMDNLIEAARQQMVRSTEPPKPGEAQKGQQPKDANTPGPQQTGAMAQQNNSTSPARQEQRGGTGNNNADLTKDIRQRASEWGHLTPRERQAVIDGTNDQPVPKYKKIIDEYYEVMSRRATQER